MIGISNRKETSEYEKDYFWSRRDITGRIRYFFRLNHHFIEVNHEIYNVCMRSAKNMQYAEEMPIKRNYRSFDNEEDHVEWEFHRNDENKVVYEFYKKESYRLLSEAIKSLSLCERCIIYGLYFEGLSERQLSKKIKLPQRTINYKKQQILKKLRKNLVQKGFLQWADIQKEKGET